MGMVSLEHTVHGRIKRVILDSGLTIKQFVHNACEDALKVTEEAVTKAKKATDRK